MIKARLTDSLLLFLGCGTYVLPGSLRLVLNCTRLKRLLEADGATVSFSTRKIFCGCASLF